MDCVTISKLCGYVVASHLLGLIVLLLDAFNLHLPEHCGLRLRFLQVAVVDDTWMFGNNKNKVLV